MVQGTDFLASANRMVHDMLASAKQMAQDMLVSGLLGGLPGGLLGPMGAILDRKNAVFVQEAAAS